MKDYIITVYNKATGARETISISAENSICAREMVLSESPAWIQIMSIRPAIQTPRFAARTARSEKQYVSTRTLRKRLEQQLCDKAMGISRVTDNPDAKYEYEFESRFIASINRTE